MFAILKKEFKSYLLTPLGYVFIGMFLVMFTLFFYLDVLSSTYGNINFEVIFYNGTTILTFIAPVLTMRMFSEERKTGTEQLILTSPRSITSVVLGKFFAALGIIAFTEICTLVYFGILEYFGDPSLKVGIITMLGFLLLSSSYIAFGMFASSITENQIIAFIFPVGVFVAMMFLPYVNSIFEPFCLTNMFYNFPQGIVSVSEIISFLSFSLLFILLTIIVLQRRKSVNK